jgi:hypothetical protein
MAETTSKTKIAVLIFLSSLGTCIVLVGGWALMQAFSEKAQPPKKARRRTRTAKHPRCPI